MAIDLNSDLGEGVGTNPEQLDLDLLQVVSSANVACGGHAGDRESMARVCDLASAHRVAIGAHISYIDRENFGRSEHRVDLDVLAEQLHEQLGALEAAALAVGSAVTYVKPHGRLYHDGMESVEIAETVIGVAARFGAGAGRSLAILGQPGSQLLAAAEAAGLPAIGEAFADRSYSIDGSLVPRSEEGSVITDPTAALARLTRLLRDDEIVTVDGTRIAVRARSICVHGDTPGAVAMARRLRAAIDSDRVKVAPFAPPPRQAVG